MSIEFLKSGLQTSLQDFGFHGQMHNGISASGAMDPIAMELANWLVSKPKKSTLLEITLVGPILKFTTDMQIAICGAYFDCLLNKTKVENNTTIKVETGDILTFNKLKYGARAYLAFTGSLIQQQFLNSFSTHLSSGFGSNLGKRFKVGDKIKLHHCHNTPVRKLPKQLQPYYSNHIQIRVTQGIEADCFNAENLNLLYSQTHTVSNDFNRMGIRLNSKSIKMGSSQSMTSSGITQGTIQIPADGQPIITSVEGQTIGGYPRIANIIQADLHLLGQLKVSHKINFVKVDVDYAQQLWKQKSRLLSLGGVLG